MRKSPLCHMRTTKAQIGLRIRAVWSAPLISLPWKYNTSTCYSRNFKTLSCLCSWAVRFEPYLIGHPKYSFLVTWLNLYRGVQKHTTFLSYRGSVHDNESLSTIYCLFITKPVFSHIRTAHVWSRLRTCVNSEIYAFRFRNSRLVDFMCVSYIFITSFHSYGLCCTFCTDLPALFRENWRNTF